MMKCLRGMDALVDWTLTSRAKPTHLSYIMQQQLTHGASETNALIGKSLIQFKCYWLCQDAHARLCMLTKKSSCFMLEGLNMVWSAY
jgi:hypothetical protein